MLRPEHQISAGRRAGIVQNLVLQGILALVIVIAAVFSRHNPTTFWLTLSLLAVPIAVSATYLVALRRAQKGDPTSRSTRRP